MVGFKVVVPDDPYAMLDDTYLNTLKGDDDVANAAAKKVILLDVIHPTMGPYICAARR